jgi:hypothetical protein
MRALTVAVGTSLLSVVTFAAMRVDAVQNYSVHYSLSINIFPF